MAGRLTTELVIAGVLLSFGVVALPLAIFFVGQQLVGEYKPDAGPMELAGDLWTALAEGEFPAWGLVLAPFVVVQLLRLARRLWRGPASVSSVTDPQTGS